MMKTYPINYGNQEVGMEVICDKCNLTSATKADNTTEEGFKLNLHQFKMSGWQSVPRQGNSGKTVFDNLCPSCSIYATVEQKREFKIKQAFKKDFYSKK